MSVKVGDLVRILKYGGHAVPDGSLGVVVERKERRPWKQPVSTVHFLNGELLIAMNQYLEIVSEAR